MIDLYSRRRRFLSFLLVCCMPNAAFAQLTLLNDMVLDPAALLMPSNATYGRAINGVSFQTEPLLTHGGYQYATWYHNGSDEDVYVGRRSLAGNTWEVLDTGSNLDNGDAPSWDAHNVISLGISGDNRMHFSWDMHGNTLRLRDSTTGAAIGPSWETSLFNTERSSLNPGGSTISTVTYPQFTTDLATGNMYLNYRTGSSGAGDQYIATYDVASGLWNSPHQFINGTNSILYDDSYGTSSNNRNAYLNGIDVDAAGRLHTTWTWRETATGSSNHDIMYAYSDDGGNTWKNNEGSIVGTLGNPIDMNSPGITVVSMDRGNTLMNQQTQAVDLDGQVHTIMWHKQDDAAPVTGFTTAPAAYFHYYRDPTTGAWNRTELPTTRAVGSRPDMAYDEYGNLYVTYVSPGIGDGGGYYTNGDLIVASASKATGYEDWEIVYTDTRDFAGEPFVDLQRLLNDGVVSVVIQENSPNTGRTGSALHVLEFDKLANKVVWAGDNTGLWTTNAGTDWDNDNNDVGDEVFANGFRVTFDDGASEFSVSIASAVAPTSTTFSNSSAHAYVLTGGGIGGDGPLSISGGGTVTLANSANTYHGDTKIQNGTLVLSGTATLSATPQIEVSGLATLDVTGLIGGLPLNGQSLVIDGVVHGNVTAANNSTVYVSSSNSHDGNLSVQSGSLVAGSGRVAGNLQVDSAIVRIGGTTLPTSIQSVTTVLDNFNDNNLSEYTKTIVNDGDIVSANVSFSSESGSLAADYGGSPAFEQAMLLRDDVNLAVGETLRVDLAMPVTSLQMDLGLAISSTDTPLASGGGDTDTRDTFDWTSVSMRPSQNNIRVNRSVSGNVDTTTGALANVSETIVTGLYITRVSDTQFTLGYTDSNFSDITATVVNFAAAGVGTALGFYADVRSAGRLGMLDNLRIQGSANIAQGETLSIGGDVTLGAGALLEFNIFSPQVGDRLEIGGHLTAAGTLAAALDPLAPTPMLGDQFDLLNFSSASGAFDSFELPALGPGLAWNVTNLLSTGILEVVADVDLDNDGDVDGRDFLAIQRLDPALTEAWQEQYGDLIALPSPGLFTAVPEPAAIYLVMTPMWSMLASRQRTHSFRKRQRFAGTY